MAKTKGSTRRSAKEPVSRFDVAEHLESEEDMARYLQACFEEADGNAGVIAAAIGHIAKAKGVSQIAKDTGLAREALYRSLAKRGNPSLQTTLLVLKALGLQLTAKKAA